MAENTNQLNISLAEAFAALPESIQDWLASEQCTIFISEINKKLGIKNEKRRIVPRLIIRLVLKDLEPGDFINELAAALNMNDQAAKALAQEIEEKIFNPIALGLRQSIGLDIKLIYFGKPSERGPAKLGEMPSQPPQAETPAAPQQFTKPFTAPIMPSAPRMPEPEEPEIGKAPALIYKKGTFGRIPIAPSSPQTSGIPVPKIPSLTTESPIIPRPPMPQGLGNRPAPETKLKVEAPLPPTTAPLEINRPAPTIKPSPTAGLGPKPTPPAGGPNVFSGQNPFPKATKIVNFFQPPAFDPQPEIKVVNYNSYLTPINELGLEKNPEPKKENVILDGNTVDLRFT